MESNKVYQFLRFVGALPREGSFKKEGLSKFVEKKLRQYSDERGVIIRSTSDLSPLEEWLLLKLYEKEGD